MAVAKGIERDFFEADDPHKMMKRIIYKKYLQAYIPMTQKYYSTLIFDGFAGEGLYGDFYPGPENLEYCGSPLVALRAAVHYFQKDLSDSEKVFNDRDDGESDADAQYLGTQRYPESKALKQDDIDGLERSKVTLFFVELKERRFQKLLQNVCKTFRRYGVRYQYAINEFHKGVVTFTSADITCHLIRGKFENVPCPTISRRERCLALVDPCGFKIKMKKLREFMGMGKEIFFNFMSSYVNRFLGHTGVLVGGLFGIPLPEGVDIQDEEAVKGYMKRYVEENGEGRLKRTEQLLQLFRKRLEEKTGNRKNLAFEMRGKKNSTIYHMVYLTFHEKGFDTMKDTMTKCSQEAITLSKINKLPLPSVSDFTMNGFNFDLSTKQSNEEVANVLYQKFVGQTVHFSEVLTYIRFETPFSFKSTQLKILEERLGLTVSIPCFEQHKRKSGTYPERLRDLMHLTFLTKPEKA